MIISKKLRLSFAVFAINSIFTINLFSTNTESFDITSISEHYQADLDDSQSEFHTPRSSIHNDESKTPGGESVTPEKNPSSAILSRTPSPVKKTVSFEIPVSPSALNASIASSTDPDSEEVREELNKQHPTSTMRRIIRKSPIPKKAANGGLVSVNQDQPKPINIRMVPLTPPRGLTDTDSSAVPPTSPTNRKLDFSTGLNQSKLIEDEVILALRKINLAKLEESIFNIRGKSSNCLCGENNDVVEQLSGYEKNFQDISVNLWKWFLSKQEDHYFPVAKHSIRSFLYPPKRTFFFQNPLQARKKEQEAFLNRKIFFSRAYLIEPAEMLAYYCGLFQYIVNNFKYISQHPSKTANICLIEDCYSFTNKDLLEVACRLLNSLTKEETSN